MANPILRNGTEDQVEADKPRGLSLKDVLPDAVDPWMGAKEIPLCETSDVTGRAVKLNDILPYIEDDGLSKLKRYISESLADGFDQDRRSFGDQLNNVDFKFLYVDANGSRFPLSLIIGIEGKADDAENPTIRFCDYSQGIRRITFSGREKLLVTHSVSLDKLLREEMVVRVDLDESGSIIDQDAVLHGLGLSYATGDSLLREQARNHGNFSTNRPIAIVGQTGEVVDFGTFTLRSRERVPGKGGPSVVVTRNIIPGQSPDAPTHPGSSLLFLRSPAELHKLYQKAAALNADRFAQQVVLQALLKRINEGAATVGETE